MTKKELIESLKDVPEDQIIAIGTQKESTQFIHYKYDIESFDYRNTVTEKDETITIFSLNN